MFCEACGAKVPDNVAFCPNCGAFIEKPAAAAEPAAPADVNPVQIDELDLLDDTIGTPKPVFAPAAETAPLQEDEPHPFYTQPEEQPQPVYAAPAAQPVYTAPQPVQVNVNTASRIPEENSPLSAWAYWGLKILFGIPVVGFVFLIIFSFNGSNVNRRSFARSYWIDAMLVAALIILFLILMAIIAASAGVGMGEVFEDLGDLLPR